MALHVQVTEAVLAEINDRSYWVASAISALLVVWAWLLTWIALEWPSLIGLVACLSVPYLAWTYLPIKVLQVIELALAPGLLPAPGLPVFEVTVATTEWRAQVIGSLLVIPVAGILYASVTRLLKRTRISRDWLIWRWALAHGVASFITAFHLFMGLVIEAYGRTPVLGVISDVARGLAYVPIQVVQFIYGEEPSLQQWGDWDVGTMLAGTGLLATLIAVALYILLITLTSRRRSKAVLLSASGNPEQGNDTPVGRVR